MSDTVSAAATGLPVASTFDRRSFLATLAGAGVLTGAEARAAEPGEIELAYAEWVRASRLADAATEAVWAIEDETYEEPERPSWHPLRDEGGYKMVVLSDNKCRCYLDDGAENIARLRQIIDAPETIFTLEGWTPDMFPPRVAAARRTLATILEWQAEAKRRADACGLTAARERLEPLATAVREKRDAILSATPATFREAAFQAALLDSDWDELALCRLVQALRTLAGIPSYDEEPFSAPVAA